MPSTTKSWHYSWNDGGGANVTAEIIEDDEARKRNKISKGFYGYDWMVNSIMYYGEILGDSERKERVLVSR